MDQDCLVRHLDRGSAASSPFVQASWSAGSFFRLSNRPSTPLALGNREPARARCRSTWTWAQTPRTTRSPPTRAAARSPAPAPPRLETCSRSCPSGQTGHRCDVFILNLRTSRETRVAGASPAGASEFLPSVWERRIAFARVYDRRRGRAGERAYLFIHSLVRGGTTRRVPSGPRARGRLCAFPPPACRRVVEPGATPGLRFKRRGRR